MTIMGDIIVPKYAYGCSSCGKEWEEWRLISESLFSTCPHCEGESAYKMAPGALAQKNKNSLNSKQKPGGLVEKAIVDAKEELKKHKENIREGDNDLL